MTLVDQTAPGEVVDLDERQWLRRHCRGDTAAFAEMLGTYRGRIFGNLVRCGVAPANRDNFFHETCLKIHTAAASYQLASPLRPWLYTVVANTVRNHFCDQANID
jgi:DNA-directed RNA polymerase specialized sigma24 family protein